MKNQVLDAECIFEKKKWISITGLCNNNCLFCLDGDRTDRYHKPAEEIKKQIKKAKEVKMVVTRGLDLSVLKKLRQDFSEKIPLLLQPQSTINQATNWL